MSGGYAVASTLRPRRIPRITSANKVNRARPIQTTTMKLSIRERIRNWLMKDNDDCEPVYAEDCKNVDLHSQGFRLQVYSASGGTIVETTKYDSKKDENRHSLYVVTEDKELGEELAKIITIESLR